jgi:hypothetical protein
VEAIHDANMTGAMETGHFDPREYEAGEQEPRE